MALRISLILAILAGLGVIGVSQFVLKPHVETIRNTRDDNKRGWDDAEGRYKKSQTELSQTKTRLSATEKSLEETKTQLVAMTGRADSEEKRANGLQANLNQTKATLKTAQDKLEQWRQTGLEPEGVKALIASEKKLQGDKLALTAELGVAHKNIVKLNDELDAIRNPNRDPDLPQTARGQVMVVDPKWDFVVLNFGNDKGLKERGVLLVSRNGELIAKVRVMSMEEQRSIANVMPGWKLKDILEGDLVFPY